MPQNPTGFQLSYAPDKKVYVRTYKKITFHLLKRDAVDKEMLRTDVRMDVRKDRRTDG